MSTLDRSDVDLQDAFWPNRDLDAADLPRDGESYDDARRLVAEEESIARDVQRIMDALRSLEVSIAKVCTVERAELLAKTLRAVVRDTQAVCDDAVNKLDDFLENQ